MNKLKVLINLMLILSIPTATISAQNFDYLQAARGTLLKGDCEKAQRYYNVYKEIEKKTDYELEREIDSCLKYNVGSSRQFKIGEMIEVDGNYYPIAHIDITGRHGWAIAEEEKRFVFSKKNNTKTGTEVIAGELVNVYTIMKGFLDTVVTLNKDILPEKYEGVTEDEMNYIYENKSLIGVNSLGKFCHTNYTRSVTIEEKLKYTYPSFSCTKTLTADYEFSFFDFQTGKTEILIKKMEINF